MSTQVSQQTVNKPITVMEQMKQPKVKERLQQALGRKANVEEFLSNVLTEIAKNSKLQECTWDSILQCAIDSANFGLIPNKQLGHAYLIPYENRYNENGTWKSRMECQLQIGYKGYIKKFAEYGMSVEVELVTHEEIREGRFEEMRGSKSYIIHKPIRSGVRKEEDIALAYAIGRCEGRTDIMAVMSIDEIKETAKSKAYDKEAKRMVSKLKGAWTNNERDTDFGEMCKKTPLRRLAKISDIDVVNRMSSYEGEKDKQFKDVTPDNTHNTKLGQAFLSNDIAIPMETIHANNKMDEILASKTSKEEQAGISPGDSINELAEKKCQEIIDALEAAKDLKELEKIMKQSNGHIPVMSDDLQSRIYDTLAERKSTLEK